MVRCEGEVRVSRAQRSARSRPRSGVVFGSGARKALGASLKSLTLVLSTLGLSTLGPGARADVVLHELNYHPPAPFGKVLEFVEIRNTDASNSVDLAGWSFAAGIEFVFPPGAVLPAGGYAVVSRDPDQLRTVFGLESEGLFGPYAGALDNSGDEVVLVDRFGAHIDSVRYDDAAPWGEGADGGGSSLQRRCVDAPSHDPRNWGGAVGELPTPLRASPASECPLPSAIAPAVVFNEIHYHPYDDRDALEEFVELYNTTGATIDLGGWTLTGVAFVFPAGTEIAAGEYLVVARDPEYFRVALQVENVVGGYDAQLSNSGERLALLDAAGNLVDVVRYSDSGDWPHAADSEGRSLEKIHPRAMSDDPASWTTGVITPSAAFVPVSVVGTLGNLLTQKVLIGVNGVGEYIVDNVVLEDVTAPGLNLLVNGDFEAGLVNFTPRGNASTSVVEEGIGVGGSAGLRVLGLRSCGAACANCSSRDSVEYQFRTNDLDTSASYRLSFEYRFVSGSPSFYCRLLNGATFCTGESLISPGRANSVLSETLPPFLSHRGRYPRTPDSGDTNWVSVEARAPSGQAVEAVEIVWRVDGSDEETVSAMRDDGVSADAFAGDGVWGVDLPPFPDDTIVLYRFRVRTTDGLRAISPLTVNNDRFDKVDAWGFYVSDNQPGSSLSIYQLRVPGMDPGRPTSINALLNCNVEEPADFIHEGEVWPEMGLRFRGNTACILTKRNLKLAFNRGRWFRGLRKLNLQGIWTDKSLLREHVAWEFIRQLGVPYCETEFIRVHINGGYHGLFLYLEHPDERFLERLGRNANGCLYKAKQPTGAGQPRGVVRAGSVGAYAALWEEETCKTGDFTGLAAFVDAMHDDGRAPGPSAEFFLTRTFPRELIGYQLAQSMLNNIDSFAKNHFLYWDTDQDRWSMITWDMDLTFGKNFDPNIRPVGTVNDCMLSPGGDLNPWFTTAVNGNFLLHHMMDFFFRSGRGHFQRAYLVRLWDLLQEKYRNEVYDPILDDLAATISEEAAEDMARWGRSPVSCAVGCGTRCESSLELLANVERVKEQIGLHRRFLVDYIRRWHPEVMEHDRMKITELMPNPFGANSGLEFVELRNTSGREIDVSGWALSDAIEFQFPAETVLAADAVVIVARSRAAFLTQYPHVVAASVFGDYTGSLGNEGDSVRLVDAGPGYPATIDFVQYVDGGRWPEILPGFSIEVIEPTPDLDNDDPTNWRRSELEFGSPGDRTPTSFVRGDVNEDGAVNLSDAVAVLAFLFQGGGAPSCDDAADVDDDGQVVLSDAIGILNYLFLQGAAPASPFPDAGRDPTGDALSCF